jgi:hypothetical protein
MPKKKHLQEIYGEEDNEIEVEEEESTHKEQFLKIIAEMKEKYGSEWIKHINEKAD